MPYESAEILHNSAILVRQFFGRNLYDRLYSQPHLTGVHKVWVTLQALCAVAQLHSVGVIHGDIKSENFFLIGSFQAVLTDLSTYIKPVYLPLNDPVAATSLFFESGAKRRRCFIAPERFIDTLTSRVLDEHGRRMTFFDKEFTREFVRMDLFSVGLTIAELFMEGQHVVDLPELLAYRTGVGLVEKISDPTVKKIVLALIQRDSSSRPNSAVDCVETLLEELPFVFRGLLVPLLAVVGHPVYANADMRMMLIRANWEYVRDLVVGGLESAESPRTYDRFTELELLEQCQSASLLSRGVNASIPPLTAWTPSSTEGPLFPHPQFSSSACAAFTRGLVNVWREGERVHLAGDGSGQWREEKLGVLINEVYMEFFFSSSQKVDHGASTPHTESTESTPLICSLLGSTAMACNSTTSKLVYLDMVGSLAESADDTCIADLIIPYVHDLALGAQPLAVRMQANACMARLVSQLGRAETGLFSEYLFPLCLTADTLPCSLGLALALAKAAIRLSEESSKKLAAIRMFIERVVSMATRKENQAVWLSALLENLDLFALLESSAKSTTLLVGVLADCAVRIRAKFCMQVANACTLLARATVEGLVVPLVLEALEAGEVGAAAALGAIVSPTTNKQLLALVVERLVRVCRSDGGGSVVMTRAAEHALTVVLAGKIPVLDQFVFLRSVLGGGTLLDLKLEDSPNSSHRDYSQRGVIWVPQIIPAMIEPNDPFSNCLLVNPDFPSPAPVRLTSPILLGLGNMKDFRLEASGTPRPLPDLGCLSNLDGSFRSLYAGGSVGGTSLQERYLATLPCVPSSIGTTPPWKPDNLLLATLTDFSSSGFAVPVVAVDSTDDGRVLVAGGADCTLKVWRTSALEAESVIQASRSWKAPPDCTRLFTLRTLRNAKSVVFGTDRRLMVFRIDTVGSEEPVAKSDEHAFGNPIAIEAFDTDLASCVMAACDKGGVLNWDLRSSGHAFSLKIDPVQHSSLTGLVVSKGAHAFAVSTLNGHLLVFDARFLKNPVSEFAHSGGPIAAMAHSAHPNSVWISTLSESSLFDIQQGGAASRILSTVGPAGIVGQVPTLSTDLTPNPDINLSKLAKGAATARSLIECAGADWTVISGHNDGVVRYWQPNGLPSGIAYPHQFDPSSTVYNGDHIVQRIVKDTESFVYESGVYAGRPCTVAEGHRDVINDICIASMQSDIIVTAGRDGLVKLWK